MEVGWKRGGKRGLGARLVGWLVGWLVESLRSQTSRVPIDPFSHHRYLTKERMIERLVESVERLRDSHSGHRLSQTQNNHWKRD